MDRRKFIQSSLSAASGAILLPELLNGKIFEDNLRASDFGKDFEWGVATAAYQIEGAWNIDGKGESIWDRFSHSKRKIKTKETGDIACDFYRRYEEDISLLKDLRIPNFRFSLAWSRILPEGTGTLNQKGIDFYKRVLDELEEKNITPWVTLYHWDLPQKLQEKGGWVNRDILNWFEEYVSKTTQALGDRVKNWMVLNEPFAFVPLGYLIGWHAPGYRSPKKFFAAWHHAAMAQSLGGRIIRENVSNSNIGTTLSCSHVTPKKDIPSHHRAVARADALLNRIFLDPIMGMGYPLDVLPGFKGVEKHIQDGDMEKLPFDFDFIGLQTYTRVMVSPLGILPMLHAKMISPKKIEGAEVTEMNWEVFPEGIYHLLKKFAAYPNIKKIIVTENGAAFPDQIENGKIHDVKRIQYFQDYLAQVLKAKNEGVNVGGYFVWTFMDNFEWAEGTRPRFGLVYNDFQTQQRTVKDSGLWFRDFISER